MERFFLVAMLGMACLGYAQPAQQEGAASAQPAALASGASSSKRTDMPPLPKAKSTILGGSIRTVDPVRDQFVLNIYGAKPMKILYDERTQVFNDGKKISLRELGPAAHASVQTALDGRDAKVFAISIHILSSQPGGNFEGRVLSYTPDSGVLMLVASGSRQAFRVVVSPQTSFKRLGQSAFSSIQSGTSDLVPGALVSVKFAADNGGKGIAQEVSVLAAPGATFIFSGTLAELDIHAGSLALLDPRTNQRYAISFDPTRDPASRLRPGQHVRISADYDGTRYVATEISIE
jgi:hypothetical protein